MDGFATVAVDGMWVGGQVGGWCWVRLGWRGVRGGGAHSKAPCRWCRDGQVVGAAGWQLCRARRGAAPGGNGVGWRPCAQPQHGKKDGFTCSGDLGPRFAAIVLHNTSTSTALRAGARPWWAMQCSAASWPPPHHRHHLRGCRARNRSGADLRTAKRLNILLATQELGPGAVACACVRGSQSAV